MEEKPLYLDLDKVGDFEFLKSKTVSIGAVFEPSIHPEFNKMIDLLNKQECKLILTTNAHNLNKKHIPALFDANLEMVTFSFDGISERTYNHIRRGGNFQKTIDNIVNFRQKFAEHNTIFAVNNTIMQYNMNEILDSAKFWNQHDFDLIRFIAMVVRADDDFLHENELWSVREQYFDQLNKVAQWVEEEIPRISIASPYYSKINPETNKDGTIKSKHPKARLPKIYPRYFQYGADFGMTFPCKSPFVAARILWDGTVMLCHNQVVGNLYNTTFADIWAGRAATELRNKVVNSHNLCNSCDYFRLCINSHYLDLDNKKNYFSEGIIAKA
jgi:radical SAM protein with 4Fe4S-binding SPASM domain